MKFIKQKIMPFLKTDNSKDIFSFILFILIIYGFFFISGIGCPIKFLTGISCMGCGMTRSYYALLSLNFKDAIYYHPLFFIPPIILLLILFKKHIPEKFFKTLIFISVTLFVITYFYRLFFMDTPIVVCHIKSGFIYKFIYKIYQTFSAATTK